HRRLRHRLLQLRASAAPGCGPDQDRRLPDQAPGPGPHRPRTDRRDSALCPGAGPADGRRVRAQRSPAAAGAGAGHRLRPGLPHRHAGAGAGCRRAVFSAEPRLAWTSILLFRSCHENLCTTAFHSGSVPRDPLRNSLDLARAAEQMGYHRFWVAEHHNMVGIASAATSVVIGYLAAGTERIRIGSGGIMLPNHSPLQIAEQFGTLESLYPG